MNMYSSVKMQVSDTKKYQVSSIKKYQDFFFLETAISCSWRECQFSNDPNKFYVGRFYTTTSCLAITRNPSHFAHAILNAPRFLKNLQSMLHGIRCQNNMARSMERCERIDYVALNNLSSADLELRLPPK